MSVLAHRYVHAFLSKRVFISIGAWAHTSVYFTQSVAECLFPAESKLCIESKNSQQHMFGAAKQGKADNSLSLSTLANTNCAVTT